YLINSSFVLSYLIAYIDNQRHIKAHVQQTIAIGCERGRTNLIDISADNAASRCNSEDFIIFHHGNRTDQLAALWRVLKGHHAQATAALWSVFLDSGALTVAAGGSHQQVATFLDDRQAQQLVIAAETHALNAGSCTAHWAQLLIIGSKAN